MVIVRGLVCVVAKTEGVVQLWNFGLYVIAT